MICGLVELTGSPWKILPAGVHTASLAEVENAFAINHCRRELFQGLKKALKALAESGCKTVYIDGSYVTGKPIPGDYDACWDPFDVDRKKLDPVFLDFRDKRKNQKNKYGGEFFPFGVDAGNGQKFIDFFQTDRFTGNQKGIVSIDLTREIFA